MSACLDYDDFAALLDGAMSARAHTVALRHIGLCPSCRELAAELGYEIPNNPALAATVLDERESNPALQKTAAQGETAASSGGQGMPDAALPEVPRAGAEPEPVPQLLLGQVVQGYRVLRQIGRGGMGAVYEVTHERMRQRAAIKVLFPEYSADPEFMKRFRAEARAASIVRHPGLVTIFNYGQLPTGMAFILMEYLPGESLRQRMTGKTPSIPEALRWGRQIASALAAVHQRGITHRDLKPENVMLVPDPDVSTGTRVKVVDFGIAKSNAQTSSRTAAGQGTGPQVFLGTVAYASPEQCQMSSRIDGKSDVYSLGITLYELIGGRLPFSGTVTDVLGMHIRDAPPLHALPPGLPPALLELLRDMLAKAPEARPTMAEVQRRLDELLSRASLAAPSRRRAWSILMPTAAAVMAVLLYWFLR